MPVESGRERIISTLRGRNSPAAKAAGDNFSSATMNTIGGCDSPRLRSTGVQRVEADVAALRIGV
jgi:hypothetical protein